MRKISTLVLVFLCSALSMVEAQVYVSQLAIAGSNDGTSWANAYLDLADAVNNAQAGDEIWVALGEFTPPMTILTDGSEVDTTHAYYIDKDIKLYGGFIGNENSIDQRNTLFNPVILNGDINDDDIINRFDTLKDDNAHHIFYLEDNLTSATVIDGFVIWRGQASSDKTGSASQGGGIYSAGGEPTINDCTINECFALLGGGIYLGGDGNNNITIEDCVIDRNAGEIGGGIYATDLASLSLLNSRVTRTKTIDEGAIVVEDINTVNFTECVVQENNARYYSALYSDLVQNFTIKKCVFTNNHANVALTIQFEDEDANENVTFDQSRVIGNTADSVSAGVAHGAGSLTLINSLFGGNAAGNPVVFSEIGSGGTINLNHSTLANTTSPLLIGENGIINTENSIFYSVDNTEEEP